MPKLWGEVSTRLEKDNKMLVSEGAELIPGRGVVSNLPFVTSQRTGFLACVFGKYAILACCLKSGQAEKFADRMETQIIVGKYFTGNLV